MFLTIGLTVLAGLAALSGAMLLMEDRFIYFPSRELVATPASLGLSYQDRWPMTDDNVRLHAWHIPNQRGSFTLLVFHGNAGNLGDRVEIFARWHRMGLGVLAVDYRGYGQSEGHPSEQGLYRDARALWIHATRDLRLDPARLIVMGRSLGSGPATQLATEVRPAGLVLESPITSVPAMARAVYPFLPVSFLARTKYDNLDKISGIACPLMVIHAEQDEIIPQWMGRRLFDAAREPKRWVSLSGRHNDFDWVSAESYDAAWRGFIQSLSDQQVVLPPHFEKGGPGGISSGPAP